MNRFLIFTLLLLSVISCTKVTTEEQAEENQSQSGSMVSLTASLSNADTRVLADTDSDQGWNFVWESTDALSAWYTGCSTPNSFTIDQENFNEQSSTFTGEVGEGGYHRFIYPFEQINISFEGYYGVDIASQDGTLNKIYLINDEQIATTSIENGEVSSLSIKHIGGFMIVDTYLENYNKDYTYILKEVSYSSTGEVIPIYADIDMTKGVDETGFYNNIATGVLSAQTQVTFQSVDDSDYLQAIARLNILPFTLKNGDDITIDLSIDVYDGESFVENVISDITLTNDGDDLSFNRATHNFTYLTVDAKYEVRITGAQIKDWSEESTITDRDEQESGELDIEKSNE